MTPHGIILAVSSIYLFDDPTQVGITLHSRNFPASHR